jgi:hypothetical protein
VRDRDVDQLERSLMVASWSVFVALHCGWTDPSLLSALRQWSFALAAGESASVEPPAFGAREIHALSEAILRSGLRTIGRAFFETRGEIYARRMRARLARVAEQIRAPLPLENGEFTIYGTEGFSDG